MQSDREIFVVYDGLCAFCSRYVMLYRIRQLAEKVHMIDAHQTTRWWRGPGPVA